jgi:hypothetical protein
MIPTFLVFVAVATSSALGAVVDYNFVISNVQASPDGFERSIVAVNGQIPGTLVTVSIFDARGGNTQGAKVFSGQQRRHSAHQCHKPGQLA